MYKFRISNREDALELVNALKENTRPLRHPYFGYLIFLATELDQEAATALLESYNGLDSLTGSLVAGIVCIDKIKVPCKGLLVGIDNDYKNCTEVLSARKLEELSRKGECTHMDLREPEYATKYLTHSTDRVARILGVTDSLPCIAVLDCNSPEDAEIVELPTTKNDLASFVRELMSELSKNDDDGSMEEILERLVALNQRSIALGHRLRQIDEAIDYLVNVTGSPQKKLVKLLASTSNAVSQVLTPERIRILRKISNSSELSEELLTEIESHFDLDFKNNSLQHDFLEVKYIISNSLVEAIAPGERAKLQDEIIKLRIKSEELQTLISEKRIPSVREAAKIVSKRKNLRSFKHNVVGWAADIAKELTKPTLWLKIAQYFS